MVQNGTQGDTREMRNPLLSFLALWKKQFSELIETAASSKVFRVKVDNDNDYKFILRQVLKELEALNSYTKHASKGKNPSQKVSIKTTDLVTLNNEIKTILEQIAKKDLVVNMPKIQKMIGRVQVENFPKEYDFDQHKSLLTDIRTTLQNLRLEVPAFPEIPQPRDVVIPPYPTEMKVKEIGDLIKEVKELKKEIKNLEQPEVIFPDTVNVGNFPPQKVPNPVTNININALRGYVKSRSVTVTTSITPLPGEVLSNRRSLVFYNNGAQTVYVGGSDVTVDNGVPVPAGTYSPAFDAGPRMIVYGIVASTTCDVRVLELSNENNVGI